MRGRRARSYRCRERVLLLTQSLVLACGAAGIMARVAFPDAMRGPVDLEFVGWYFAAVLVCFAGLVSRPRSARAW
jgi:hypothetical protein